MNKIQNANMIFWQNISKYDSSNPNILRKIIHSFTVANTAFDIACRFMFNQSEREFCYILGLFHDIGRFPQWQKYQTYDDNKSKNHGNIGYEEFLKLSPSLLNLKINEFSLLAEVIKFHSQPYMGHDENVKKYLSIIHNADAFANVITTANGSQQLFTDLDGYSQNILNAFYNGERLYMYSTPTKLDRVLKLASGINNVEIDFLRREIIDKNYINIIYKTYSKHLNKEDRKIYKNAIEFLSKNFY